MRRKDHFVALYLMQVSGSLIKSRLLDFAAVKLSKQYLTQQNTAE